MILSRQVLLSLLIWFGMVLPTLLWGQNDRINIGFVMDGPWEQNERVQAMFVDEIRELTRMEFDIHFPAHSQLVGDWTQPTVERHLQKLLDDPDTDLIIGLGVIASNAIALQKNPSKPVIAPFVIDINLQDMAEDIHG